MNHFLDLKVLNRFYCIQHIYKNQRLFLYLELKYNKFLLPFAIQPSCNTIGLIPHLLQNFFIYYSHQTFQIYFIVVLAKCPYQNLTPKNEFVIFIANLLILERLLILLDHFKCFEDLFLALYDHYLYI